jgi:hypothetical protein
MERAPLHSDKRNWGPALGNTIILCVPASRPVLPTEAHPCSCRGTKRWTCCKFGSAMPTCSGGMHGRDCCKILLGAAIHAKVGSRSPFVP